MRKKKDRGTLHLGLLLYSQFMCLCRRPCRLGRRDYVTGEMNKFKKAPYRLLLNRKGGEEMAWHVEHYGSLGIMRRVENAADVAQLMGIPLASIKQTFDEYRRVAAQGHDDFGKCEPKDFKVSLPMRPLFPSRCLAGHLFVC